MLVACLRLGRLSLSFTSVFVFQHVSAGERRGVAFEYFFFFIKRKLFAILIVIKYARVNQSPKIARSSDRIVD